jgi:hypothetical protein
MMNEFMESRTEIPPLQDCLRLSERPGFGLDAVVDILRTFATVAGNSFKDSAYESMEIKNIREYGLRECADAAKNIFTREVFSDWGRMGIEQRGQIVREYSKAIGNGLNIDFKGVVFEPMKNNISGYNNGNGRIYLNDNLLRNPSEVINLIDTITHEARHQMQFEAIQNPEKFGLDLATLKEWTAGMESYTSQWASEYDPWGYFYNPVELDARYFGESVVRELGKELINNADSANKNNDNSAVAANYEKSHCHSREQFEENRISGKRREFEVERNLRVRYPESKGYNIEREVYLRDRDGNIVKDPETTTGRRIDFVVIDKTGKVVDSIEVTSKSVDKFVQMSKELRIRENGGNYIRIGDGTLVEIPGSVQTRIERMD